MSEFFTTEKAVFHRLEFITVKSNALKKRADITLFKPEDCYNFAGIVILLHGVYGSHWAWALKGNVYTTTQKLMDQKQIKPTLLVMPSDGLFGDGSGYLPHHTEDYEKWIVEEVIQVVKEQNPQISDDIPIFITGLSMGGYGAMRLGAKYPEKFKAFSGLSSITEFSQMKLFVEDFEKLKVSVILETSVLREILNNRTQLAPFRFDCGSDDLLIEANRKLHFDLLEKNVPHIYKENEGGHTWEYWSEHIKETLLFFNQYC
ncbi:MAG: alpha/beta hydrolase-fold protein [Bacteroidota bacterium]